MYSLAISLALNGWVRDQRPHGLILGRGNVFQLLAEIRAIEIAHAHGERTRNLVAIARTDAAHRGADVLAARSALVQDGVFGHVPGKDHVRPIAEHQVVGHLDAASVQAVYFLQDAGRIDHHAAGDDALHLGAQDAAGNERQFVGLAAGDYRVPGVAAALIADDDFVFIGQQIDELAFGFVAPLQADHARNWHRQTSFGKLANRR